MANLAADWQRPVFSDDECTHSIDRDGDFFDGCFVDVGGVLHGAISAGGWSGLMTVKLPFDG